MHYFLMIIFVSFLVYPVSFYVRVRENSNLTEATKNTFMFKAKV